MDGDDERDGGDGDDDGNNDGGRFLTAHLVCVKVSAHGYCPACANSFNDQSSCPRWVSSPPSSTCEETAGGGVGRSEGLAHFPQ